MTQNQERYEDRLYGPQKPTSMASRPSLTISMPASTTEDEVVAELDEPPERKPGLKTDFHRSNVRPNNDRQESLLTRALLSSPDCDTFRPDLHLLTDIGRRRSINSNTSSASSMTLTSDGDLTSPTRTNTPSPPFPATLEKNMALLNVGSKANSHIPRSIAQNPREPMVTGSTVQDFPEPTKTVSTVETLTKKRCITFACGGQKPPQQGLAKPSAINKAIDVTARVSGDNPPQRRACAIKFACQATAKQGSRPSNPSKTLESASSRSPTAIRKIRSAQSPRPSSRTSPTLSRRLSQSPVATRKKRPMFLTANQSSDATRFHEFASEVVEEEDWIRRDSSDNKKKITINDILRKENAIRQIGKEAEEEALEEEEAEDEEDNEQDEDDEEDREDSDDAEGDDDQSEDEADVDYSDGNETDNEAGFAESDDESDSEEFRFWTLGRSIPLSPVTQKSPQRASPKRTNSESSIDSPRLLSLPVPWCDASAQRSKLKSPRRPKIRPGTPDLPDSTDFVCGTLDEDRPLEEAYVSCMEVRKRERHRVIPQDIDPSFPTSDPEHEDDDEEDDYKQNDSDEPLWIHGKFEESDEHDQGLRRPRTRKSPLQSPKRMHSPPPKQRMRSPAPRRHLGVTSPRRMRSPHPSREADASAESLVSQPTRVAISFAPLGARPGLTHTKSLPRTPNAFCKQYRTACLAAANANLADEETTDGYSRGAIDIVKGLERKRQHRREKLLRKQNNRARKCGPERKPQPGKGAERMRELGLHMAGKGGAVKAEYILSI